MNRYHLPSYVVKAYNVLYRAASEADDKHLEISTDAAQTALEDAGQDLSHDEVEHVLNLLCNCGEIYRVNNQIRFTDPEKFSHQYIDDEVENGK